MPKIKILVSYKQRHPILQSDIIIPIQTGRALSSEIFSEMIGDDTGDNISTQNTKYNELSAQYWAWKNYDKLGNPDYIGFMHYRRHFLFNTDNGLPKEKWLPDSDWYKYPQIDTFYTHYFDSDAINKVIQQADCFTVKPFDYPPSYPRARSLKQEHLNWSQELWDRLQLCSTVVGEIYPQYKQTALQIVNGHLKYICNMFIMKKDLFFKYNTFLFTILKKMDSIVDSTYDNKQNIRFLGYMGEYLLTVFLIYNQKYINIKYIPGCYVTNTDLQKITYSTSQYNDTNLRKELAQIHFPNINNRFAANEYNNKLLFVIEHPMRFKLKKSWYAIKKAFAFGKRYQKYKQKYQSLKTLLKDAKKLKKSFFKI